MSKRLAIMGKPHLGVRDVGTPVIWFSVESGVNLEYESLQILSVKEFCEVLEDANIYDMESLAGKPCQIEVSDNNEVRFIKVITK